MIQLKKIIFGGIYSFPREENVFEFTNGFHLLVGDNGAGKSSFLNLIPLVLFDRSPSVGKKGAVNEKEEYGYIVLYFSVDGIDYCVDYRRSLKKLDWFLFKIQGNSRFLLTSGVEVGNYLEKLFGFGYDQFINSFYLTQDFHSFKMLYGDPSDRLDILSRIFGLNRYLVASDLAKKKSEELFMELSLLEKDLIWEQSKLNNIKEKIKGVSEEQLRFNILQLELGKQEKERIYQEFEIDFKKELNNFDSQLKEIIEKENNIKRDIIELNSRRSDLKLKLEKFSSFKSLKLTYDDDCYKLNIFNNKREEIFSVILEKKNFLEILKDRKETLNNKLSGIMKGEGICDRCGSKVSKEHLDAYRDSIIKEVSELNDKILLLENEISNLSNELSIIDSNINELRSKIEQFERNFVDFLNKDFSNFDLDIDNYKNHLNELDFKNAQLEMELLDISQKRKLIEDLKSDLLSKRNDYINKLIKEMNDYTKEIVLAKSQLDDYLSNLNNIKEVENRIKDLNNKFNDIKLKYECYHFWINGFKEIATLRLYRFIEDINKRLEDILEDFGLNCWIDVLEKKKSAKDYFSLDSFKRKANIFVSGNGKDNVPVEAYSGGERQLLSLALVLSLGAVIGNINYLALDEVFGSLDSNNRSKVLEMLNRERLNGLLKNKCIFIVSHDDEIKNGLDFDSIIKVKKENGFSKLIIEDKK